MDWPTLRRSIDLLLQSRRPEVTLSFYGGEPLLAFDLIERAVRYVSTRRRSGPRVKFATITNGTLLEGKVADFLARHRVRTRISFDGVPEVQDWRGPGTHRILLERIGSLRDRHPRFFREQVEVSMTVMSTTLPRLADSFAQVLELGFREIHLAAVDRDAGWRPELMETLDRQFERIWQLSVDHQQWTGEVPLLLFRRGAGQSVHAPVGRSLCGVSRGEALAVDVDGEVHGCATFARSYQKLPAFLESRLEAMRLGSVSGAQLPARLAAYPAAAHAAEIFDHKEEKFSSYGNCADCLYLSSCSVCPVSIGQMPGNTDPRRIPDHLCAFNLVSCKWRDRFPAQRHPLEALLGRSPLPGVMQRLRAAGTGRESWSAGVEGSV